ncbi:MAG: S1C family serine protease [Patescibacteria group bacterium]|jgi:hypothetical protein
MHLTEIPTFPPEARRGLPLAIFIALGVISGAIGAGLLLSFVPSLRRAEIPLGTQSVIVSSPGTVVVEEGTRISDIIKQGKAITAAVYNPKSVIHIGDKIFYPPTAAKGGAISLTGDGWFATVSDVPLSVGDIIYIQSEAHGIVKIVKDPATPFVLLKVGEGNFSSARFTSANDYKTGMTVIASTPAAEAVRMNVTNIDLRPDTKDGATRSSDTLSSIIGVTQTAQVMSGSPVFTLNGDVAGLTQLNGSSVVVLPGEVLRELFDRVLRYGQPNRAFLGMRYAVLVSDDEQTSQAVIYSSSGSPVVLGSPAAKAGFKSGDVIVSIDGKNASESSDIFGIVSAHVPGDEISVKYSRGSQTFTKTVKLTSLSPGG